MTASSSPKKQRTPLNKEVVVRAAITLADTNSIESLSMRKLGDELNVEAMALYHHFPSKNDLIEAMIDHIHGEIKTPVPTTEWQLFMRQRAYSALEVLQAHPWAASYMEAGTKPGHYTLQDREKILECFRTSGFSIKQSVHATTILDVYIYGFAHLYSKITFKTSNEAGDVSEKVKNNFTHGSYPYLEEMIEQHMLQGKYDILGEFEFGLNLILNGLETKG